MRLVIALVAAVIASNVAHAGETGMLPNGAKITWERFFIKDRSGEFAEPATPEDRRYSLNFAHCACSKAMAGMEQTFQYEIKLTANTMTGRPAEVWVGTQCDNDQVRAMQCRKIEMEGILDIDAMVTTPEIIELSFFDLINASPADNMLATCKKNEGDALLWVMVDTNGDGTYEYTSNIAVAGTAPAAGNANTDVTKYDTQEPPQPTDFRATSGEGSIDITWTPPMAGGTDVYFYQALCADEEGMPLTGISPPDARFQTTDMLCDLPVDFALAEAQVDGEGAPIASPIAPFSALDRDYVCGEAAATAPSMTIEGLENDRQYQVAIVVVDLYGNAVGSYFNRMVVPKPVTDFWEDLHDRNSAVDGGCLLATTYGNGNPLTQTLRSFRDRTLAKTAFGRALTRAYYGTIGKLGVYIEGSLVLRVIVGLYLLPVVVLALLWHFLTLPGLIALGLLPFLWRRRKRLVLAAALLAPSVASADDFEPYWETDENSGDALLEYPEVKWHVGIRLGPYIPDIDIQAGLNAATGLGPYEAMFGDYYTRRTDGTLKKHEQRVWQVLPMLDAERVLWDGYGQFLVGGQIGYMQKTAYTYLDGTSADDPMRERSRTSKNTFRLIPTAATVSYRFTTLDDYYGIPIVPFVRAGLSYYMWWIRAPNGDVSKVCEDTAADMSCANEDKAYGGSLGYQGSVGLSVRAERIDNDAAISMRASGIQHAGFYVELSYAKVDGFGSDSKLSVGDNTWFAGFDFEF